MVVAPSDLPAKQTSIKRDDAFYQAHPRATEKELEAL